MAEIAEITKENFDTEVLSSETLTLVYYYAPWCKPCQETDEIIQTAADEVDGQIAVVKANTDIEEEIVLQQKVRTLPTLQLLKKGQVLETLRGVPSKLELMGMLSNAIAEHAPAQEPADAKPEEAPAKKE